MPAFASWKTLAIVCGLAALLAPQPALAEGWMFGKSYYSHANSPGFQDGEIPSPRSAYRQAFVGAHPRFAIRGGWRMNSIVISNGYSVDRTIIREDWFDADY